MGSNHSAIEESEQVKSMQFHFAYTGTNDDLLSEMPGPAIHSKQLSFEELPEQDSRTTEEISKALATHLDEWRIRGRFAFKLA